MTLSRIGSVGGRAHCLHLREKVSLNFTIFCGTDLQRIGVRPDIQLHEVKSRSHSSVYSRRAF